MLKYKRILIYYININIVMNFVGDDGEIEP